MEAEASLLSPQGGLLYIFFRSGHTKENGHDRRRRRDITSRPRSVTSSGVRASSSRAELCRFVAHGVLCAREREYVKLSRAHKKKDPTTKSGGA